MFFIINYLIKKNIKTLFKKNYYKVFNPVNYTKLSKKNT